MLDTAGNPFTREEPFFSRFQELMELTDLFLLDIKIMDGEKHRFLTGHGNENILDMARFLSDRGKDVWLRHVLVPGLTDGEEDLRALAEFAASLKNVKRFEVLPYHTLGLFKWEKLGILYTLKEVPVPAKEEVDRACRILRTEEYRGYLGQPGRVSEK